jgi:hypothetical protein
MVNCKVFKPVLKSGLPPGTKIIDSVWAMKKKSNGTLRGRINARGFKQVEGQHYDGMTISSPGTNSATIRIVLVLMVMADMIAHMVDVKRAFLHGEVEDGKKIHMKIPKGFKKHFLVESVLLLLKMPVWTQASCESILETALMHCESNGTNAKQCRSLSLLQVG